jgi:parvulin-like peptidyl-prolyl isomerase
MRNDPPSTSRRVRSAHDSKSATVRAAAAAPSRRQQSHWQREQHQQRMLYIAVGVLVVVVAAIFAGGVLYDNVIRANAVVAQIGPDSITASQLLDEVRPQSRALDAQAAQLGGSTDNQQIADYLDQQKRSLPDQVLNDLVDDHIIQQEAARRGISVTPAEVDDKERQTVAQYQANTNPTPTPEASSTPEASGTPAATGEALTSATPELTTLPVQAAVSSPTDVASPTALTTPTPVPTLEASAYAAALQDLLSKNNLDEAELRKQLERSLLQQKVQDAIGQDQAPDNQPQVHARQIVVPSTSQDQANSLEDQIKNQGADFAQLAQQNSTDAATRDKGGDMGWFPKGVQTAPIDAAVFSLQPGQTSDPILDSAGYHIIQVLETDPSRPVAPDQLSTLRSTAYSNWLSQQHGSPDIKLSLDQSEKNWVLARIGVRP